MKGINAESVDFPPMCTRGVDYCNNNQWQVDWQDDDMKESCTVLALLGCTASKDCLLTQESKAYLISANCSTFYNYFLLNFYY